MKIIPWLGIAMIAVGFGADAQGVRKCVGEDGKAPYSNDPCPGSTEIQSAPPAAAGGAAIPELQAGKWKMRFSRDGRTAEDETCGNPIDGFRRDVKDYETTTRWGCTMTTNASGPRSVRIVYDCPSDRAPDGRAVQKGRAEFSLVSASPQAFRIEMTSTVYPGYVMEGTRIGECEKR